MVIIEVVREDLRWFNGLQPQLPSLVQLKAGMETGTYHNVQERQVRPRR